MLQFSVAAKAGGRRDEATNEERPLERTKERTRNGGGGGSRSSSKFRGRKIRRATEHLLFPIDASEFYLIRQSPSEVRRKRDTRDREMVIMERAEGNFPFSPFQFPNF